MFPTARLRRSFQFHLWSALIPFLFLTLFVVFGVTNHLFYRQFNHLIQYLYAEVGDEIARDLLDELEKGDPESLRREFAAFEARDPRISLFLIDQTGAVLVGSPSIERFMAPPRRFDANIVRQFLTQTSGLENPLLLSLETNGQQEVFTASNVRSKGASAYLLAILNAHASVKPHHQLWRSRQLLLFLYSLFTCSVVSWVAFLFLTRRISAVGSALERFAKGDYRYRVKLGGGDELGAYATLFNAMADRTVQAMDSLSAVERERRELFANVSHDLRRPIASIMNSLEALADETVPLSDDQCRALLERATKRAEDLGGLVREVAELSALATPTVNMQARSVALHDEVRELVGTFGFMASERKIELTVSIESEVAVRGEQALLRRAIANLLENALLYTKAGGRVAVRLSTESGRARLSIADSGTGIQPQDLALIFTPFSRGAEARALNNKGTGLGLSIVKRIVALHKGDIRVESTVGRGSEFIVELPLS